MSELATPPAGARKKRDTQPKTGTQIPIVQPKPQRVQIVSGDRDHKYELKLLTNIQEGIELDLSSFELVPQKRFESIVMKRLRGQINLQEAQVQDSYPIIELDKILSVFFNEQEKMYEGSFLEQMEIKQNFAVCFIKDRNNKLCIARFFVRPLHKLVVSIHTPDQIPFLFEDGFIATKLQLENLQSEMNLMENIFSFVSKFRFNKN